MLGPENTAGRHKEEVHNDISLHRMWTGNFSHQSLCTTLVIHEIKAELNVVKRC